MYSYREIHPMDSYLGILKPYIDAELLLITPEE